MSLLLFNDFILEQVNVDAFCCTANLCASLVTKLSLGSRLSNDFGRTELLLSSGLVMVLLGGSLSLDMEAKQLGVGWSIAVLGVAGRGVSWTVGYRGI